MIKQLTLTLNAPAALTRVAMAKWIMEHKMPNQCNSFTSREAMGLVDRFIDGEDLVLEMHYSQDTPYETCPFLDCKSVVVEDEYDRALRERHEEWAVADDLRERGAAGDAEAAIAFCKLNHVRLFAAYAG